MSARRIAAVPAAPDDPTSFAETAFLYERDLFEAAVERFLSSPATQVGARRRRAVETVNRFADIGLRLRGQGLL